MKVDLDCNLESYVQQILAATAKCMIWASLAALILNSGWFFFDDFLKTLFQEIAIASAAFFSFITLRLSRKGRIIAAIRFYGSFGLAFGSFIIWSAGDWFLFTGYVVLSILALTIVFALCRKEALIWIIACYLAGFAGLLLKYVVNPWGEKYTIFEILQHFFFNNLIMSTLIFFGYKVSKMLKITIINSQKANELLYEQSITDILTGLNNRQKIDHVLNSEMERVKRYNTVFSLILLDIDHFKKVNDNYGHQTGDKALEIISGLIKENIRTSDIPGRWGGEEFMIICPETDKESAFILAEKIRKLIMDYDFSEGSRLTSSFGITEYVEGDTVVSLIKRADDALYKAKARGRNNTVIAEIPDFQYNSSLIHTKDL